MSGHGIAMVGGKEYTIRAGDVFFIPPGEEHFFKTSDEPMEI
ncbi:MAG: AraC family ligand binding domain-containing protein [Desulfobacterales bacterium]|nr:AraC family ligand binding domain-containing protein [Desulfobacterales bacterium]